MRRSLVGLAIAASAVLAACSDSEVVVGATDADAVAEASAPVEIDEFNLPDLEELSADYPLLEYATDRQDFPSLGAGRFVLVDDIRAWAAPGPSDYPHFAFTVNAWAGETEEIVWTIAYGNSSRDGDDLGSTACNDVWGQLDQIERDVYSVRPNQLPQVRDVALLRDGEGCSIGAPPAPVDVFRGPFTVEFGDASLTITSADGQQWDFLQIAIPPLPVFDPTTVTAVETTTTTTTTTIVGDAG